MRVVYMTRRSGVLDILSINGFTSITSILYGRMSAESRKGPPERHTSSQYNYRQMMTDATWSTVADRAD